MTCTYLQAVVSCRRLPYPNGLKPLAVASHLISSAPGQQSLAPPHPAPHALHPQTCTLDPGATSRVGDHVCSAVSSVLFLGANAPMPSVNLAM